MVGKPTFLKHLRTWLLGLFPWAEPSGTKAYGEVSSSSPVLLTGNSGLTHLALSSALGEIGAYVISVDSQGRDLLSAAAGDLLATEQVIEALSQSGIAERVERRTVILSGALQPFVDAAEVEAACGWEVVWGPVDIALLDEFLQGELEALPEEGLPVPLGERLRIVCSFALPTSVLMALPGLLIKPRAAAWLLGLSWAAILLFEFSSPVLKRRGDRVRHLGPAILLGLIAGGASLALSHRSLAVGAAWAGAATVVSVWLGCLFPTRALPPVERSDGQSDREPIAGREMRGDDDSSPWRTRQTGVVEKRA